MKMLMILLLTSYFGTSLGSSQPSNANFCHCRVSELCRPIEGRASQWEVVGFTYGSSHYRLFDWSKLTTLVIFGVNSETANIVCLAHEKNVRVHLLVKISTEEVSKAATREAFVRGTVKLVQEYHLDGVNMDFEEAVRRNGTAYNGLTAVMESLKSSLKGINPLYQLSMDYVYCPYCSSTRTYDIKRIQNVVDYFVLMDYDLQGTSGGSSKNGLCSDLVNSPLTTVMRGAKEFLSAGFLPGKLVLAFPWYGLDYPCTNFSASGSTCYVDCNDRWNRRYTLRYSKVMKLLREKRKSPLWNDKTSTPFFTYAENGQVHQVNYDDPQSLRLKNKVSVSFHLRGVGVWNIDFLDYSNTTQAVQDRQNMWEAIPGRSGH